MQLLQGEEKQQALDEADYYASLAPREQFKSAETVGIEETDGEKAYKVKLVDKRGDESTAYYSVESGLRLRVETEDSTQVVKKYEEYEGVKMPVQMLITVMSPIGEMVQEMTFTKVEPNVDLPGNAFSRPGAS